MPENNSPLVSVVIPCLDEEASIGICVQKALDSLKTGGIEGEVIVADNGSTDRSVEIAEKLGARIVFENKNRGYGAALMAGINSARGRFIVMGDADDSYDFSITHLFVEKLEEGYDIVMGNRFEGGIEPGAMPVLHRYFGNPAISWLARKSSGSAVSDFYCGMRGFRRDLYEKLGQTCMGMEFAIEMLIEAQRLGAKIGEIPIKLYPDKRGRAPHLRTFRDGWRTLRFILTYAPDFLYLFPGVTMFILGLFLQVLLIGGPIYLGGFYIGIHYLALGSLFSLLGFNILQFWLFARAIVAMRKPLVKDRVAKWLNKKLSFETSLAGGVLLVVGGLSIDSVLLWKNLTIGGPMKESIHLVFVATTTVAIGAELVFVSFLLNLFMAGKESADG